MAASTETRKFICLLCHKRVHRQRNGEWYHNRTASVSCHPGSGDGRKALAFEITADPRKAGA